MTWMFSSVVLLVAISGFRTGLALFDTNIVAELSPNKDSVHVQFDTHKYNYSLYHLEMLKCETEKDDCLAIDVNEIYQGDIPGMYPVTQTDIRSAFPSGIYCIRVNPVSVSAGGTCVGGCRTLATRISINTTDMPHCFDWNANVRMDPEKSEYGNYTIKVFINVMIPFQKCFDRVNVTLWYGMQDICDTNSGYPLNTKVYPLVPGKNTVAVFDNLPPGNYCTRLNAYSPYCFGTCMPLYSTIEILQGTKRGMNESKTRLVQIWPYIVGIIIFIVLLISAAVMFSKKYRKSIKQVSVPCLRPEAPPFDDELELVLLYSPDLDEHINVVATFHDFLLNYFGFKKVRFNLNEEHIIAFDSHSWLEEITDCKAKRRFIIVESEGWMLQDEGMKRLQVLQRVDGDYWDSGFLYAIKMLKNSPECVFWDHEYVFVVKFEYTPDSKRVKSFLPKRRYHLPDHLFELYRSLRSCPFSDSCQFERKKWAEWKPFLESKLIPNVEACKKRLKENPDLIRESYVEQDLMLCN